MDESAGGQILNVMVVDCDSGCFTSSSGCGVRDRVPDVFYE